MGREDGSHLHGPLELLTSDRPVEGLEQKHTAGPESLRPGGPDSGRGRMGMLPPPSQCCCPSALGSKQPMDPCMQATINQAFAMCWALSWGLETQG